MEKYLVTSALPYANGHLHIGHVAGAYLPADIFVRYLRLKEKDVLFICGTDEHGAPISIQAERDGITPQELVAKYHKSIHDSFKGLSIDFDNFSGTARPEHIETSQQFFLNLLENGYINVHSNEQFYCENCRRFLADRYVEGTCPFCNKSGARGDQCDNCGKLMDTLSLQDPHCKICNQKPIVKETSHWFLNLPACEYELRKWLETKTYWKDNILGFIMGLLDEGLVERAITRDIDWGVPVPLAEAKGKVLYVWFEAPIGYISSTVEWAKKTGQPDKWKDYWFNEKTKLIHFIGKDNSIFHAIFWPAVLMGQRSGYVLPHDIPANEFLNLEGDKISTSNNWAIWVNGFLKVFNGELLRYYLAAIAPESKDSDFSWKEFQDKNNSELANTFGNLVNRVLTFSVKHFEGRINRPHLLTEASKECLESVSKLAKEIDDCYNNYRVRKAVKLCMDIARIGNRYFDSEKPWSTLKTAPDRAEETLYVCLSLIADLSILLYPIMPNKMAELREMLSLDKIPHWNELGHYSQLDNDKHHQFYITDVKPLFPRIEDAVIEQEISKLYENSKKDNKLEHKEIIEYDDFSKLEIRVAKIIDAKEIPKANKLLKLTVSLGSEKRTIVAGVAEHYKPQDLIGKKAVVLVNLKPRKIFEYESQGMVLAAESDDKLVIITPETDIEEGSPVS